MNIAIIVIRKLYHSPDVIKALQISKGINENIDKVFGFAYALQHSNR